ncbi:MAG: PrsW family intramembrane metalloprotease [Eggerthellaceae bacterium]|nr:PrsW family intramembrane metalloprotease [Eggerthellaceae bacterium]
MAVLIAFACCLAPSLALFFWVKSLQKGKPGYADTCKKALLNGFLSTVPVVAICLVLSILGSLTGLGDRDTIPGAIYRCFVMFALAEEGSKFFLFRYTLKKTTCDVSWFDAVAFMVLVGVGFGILENIFYSLEMGLGQAIIRGVTIGHGCYGFIMGYFYGKAIKTGKKWYYVVAFVLPYLLHAFYDFGLSPVLEPYFIFGFISVTLAALDLVLVIIMVVFFARRHKDQRYTAPLGIKVAAAEIAEVPAEE